LAQITRLLLSNVTLTVLPFFELSHRSQGLTDDDG
jgi:hypothetical protein